MHYPRILTKTVASLLVLGAAGVTSKVRAANLWDGGGASGVWSDILNWDNDQFPIYGTLTFAGSTRTTNIVDASISQNELLWTGTSPWTLNNSNAAVISLFDNGGVQSKVENQSTGLVTINAPITFAATSGASWGEINAVNGGLTFGTGTLTVNGSAVNGIRMFGGGQTTTFNNTVSAAGKYFATTAVGDTIAVGGAFTSGDFYLMDGGTLKLNSTGSISTSGLRLGGDFGTTGTQDLTKGATFQLTSTTGGQTFASNINSVSGNTSNALLVDSQNTSGTNTLSGTVFLDAPLTFQQAAGGTLAITGVVSNGSGLTKAGNGILTLSNTNTFTGGVTLNAGTLNVNNAAALGNTVNGALTINGGVLDNTSGAAITTTTAKTLNINGDFTFTGTNNLSLNLGTATLGGAAGTRTISVTNAAATLSVGLLNSNAGVGLTKVGPGTLMMGSAAGANTSTINGTLDLQAGKVQVASDFTVGGLTGSGTIENGGTASKWLFVNNAVDNTFSGTIQNNPSNPANVRLGLVKSNTGTLTLTGTNNFGDNFEVRGGVVVITGNSTTGYNNGGQATIGDQQNINGTLLVNGGTFNATRTGSPSLVVGGGDNGRGFLKLTSGTINTTNQLNVGNGSTAGASSFGAFSMSGGTVNSGNWFVVGANNDRDIFNQSGGTLNVLANRMTVGAGGNGAIGILNVSGGTLSSLGGIFLGENGTGYMNLSGTGTITSGTNTMVFGNNASSLAATLNLNGGTLAAGSIVKGASTAGAVYLINFNGGTVKANATSTTFLSALANTTAYVNPGGAVFDTNGFDDTVGQVLNAPTGSGLSAIAIGTAGVGYLDTPMVTITGGTGVGAQAVANVTGGVVTGYTITNPGVGYLPTDTLTVTLFGGGATTAATAGTVTLAPNASGGVTKKGNGTLTLTGANTYTGATVINAGTLSTNQNLGAGNASVVINAATLNFSGGTTTNVITGTGNITTTGTVTVNGDLSGFSGTFTHNAPGASVSFGSPNGTNANTAYVLSSGGSSQGIIAGAAGTYTLNMGSLAGGTVAGAVLRGGNAVTGAVTFSIGALSTSTTFAGSIADGLTMVAGLTKVGTGELALSGTNTYTGPTAVNNGTLTLNGAGTLTATNGITINGAAAKLLQTSSVALTQPVTVNTGTLDGTGTVNTVTVNDGTGGIVTNGNGTGNLFSLGTLTFNGGGAIKAVVSSEVSPGLNIGTLTTGAVNTNGIVSVSAANTNGLWTNGLTYLLAGYSTLGGKGFSAFSKGTITGLGARQNATLGNSGSAITLAISGDLPVWTGALNGRWTTAVLGAPKNWKLQSAGTTTDFITGDVVVFDDNATGTPAVNISDANVSVTSASFNNNFVNYTVSSAGGFGITGGSLSKAGIASVTISTANTYTGGTTVNDGVLILSGNNNFGTGGITMNGGVTTISGTNTYTGATILNAGALNLNHAGALGTSTLTIAGGTIDNTSAGSVTLTGSNPQNWNADINFTGTKALNLGTGAVTLGTSAALQTINITNNSTLTGTTLTVGGPVTSGNGGAAGTKTLNFQGTGDTALTGSITAGGATGVVINDSLPGTLTLSGAASSITTLNLQGGASSIVDVGSGNLTVADGGGNIVQSTTGGTINGTGGGSIVLGSANGDFGTAGGTTLTVNAKFSGTNALDFYNANGGAGLGTIVLATALNNTGGVNVQNTHLVIPATGSINGANTANIGQINVADISASAALDLNGGTINATKPGAPSLLIANANGSNGAVNVTSGTINSTSESWVGSAAGGYGALTMTGGTVNVGNWLAVGRNGSGYVNVSGGTLNVTGQNFTTGSFTGANGSLPGAFGVVNLTGGAVNVTNTGAAQGGYLVGESGTGNLNVSGTAVLTISGARGLNFATNAGGTGIANLNAGGTVVTPLVQKGGGTATLNFNGGILKASAASTTFMTGLTAAYVNSGGAIIDDGGFAITVAQPLLAPTGNGVSAVSFTTSSGYVGAPLVQISGDGTGATAIAQIDAGGNLTGIVVTNPGVNYTSASATLIGGGGFGFANSADVTGNVSGGFTKRGNGTLTLAGANTYTGATVVEAGTLALTGSISGTNSINVKAGATLDVSGAAGFFLAGPQVLKGDGIVVGGVAASFGAVIAPGQGIGTLTFTGALDVSQSVLGTGTGALAFDLGTVASSDKIALTTGTLNIGSGNLAFDDFVFTKQAGFGAGTYKLFDGNTPIIGTLDPTTADLTGSLGGGFTGTLALADGGNDLTLTVVPEPGTAAILLGGVGMLCGLGRRRRRGV